MILEIKAPQNNKDSLVLKPWHWCPAARSTDREALKNFARFLPLNRYYSERRRYRIIEDTIQECPECRGVGRFPPCNKHENCFSHITHPCEGCGRIQGICTKCDGIGKIEGEIIGMSKQTPEKYKLRQPGGEWE